MECNNFYCINEDVENQNCKLTGTWCNSIGCKHYKNCSSCKNKENKSVFVCEYGRIR